MPLSLLETVLFTGMVVCFVGCFVCAFLEHAVVGVLVRELYRKHPERWRKVGRPGTPFFRGEPDCRFFARSNAFLYLVWRLRGEDVRKEYSRLGYERLMWKFELIGRVNVLLFVAAAIGIWLLMMIKGMD